MAKKTVHSNILGIIILILGVVIGVILVKQTQDFRNRAEEASGKIYTICHKTEGDENIWQEVLVGEDELEEHMNHGDIFGECPEVELK